MKLWNSLADDGLVDWCMNPEIVIHIIARAAGAVDLELTSVISRQPTVRFKTQSRPCSFGIIPFHN